MLSPSLPGALALAACLLGAACGGEEPAAPPPAPPSAGPTGPPRAGTAPAPEPVLHDEAGPRGLDYVNRSGSAAKAVILEANGAGVALLDLGNDGDLDVVFAQGLAGLEQLLTGPGADLEVFENDGTGRFERRAGPGLAGWWTGLASGDFDGDGQADLVAGGFGSLRALLQREGALVPGAELLPEGRARLEIGAPRAAGAPPDWVTSLAPCDLDRDGVLDLYVGRYLDLDPLAPPIGELRRGELALPCEWKGLAVYCGPRGLEPQPDLVLRGLGDGTFEDQSTRWLPEHRAGYTLGVLAVDVDGDGDVDLFVANDSSENLLLLNDGTGRLTDVGYEAGLALSMDGRPEAGMGVAAADVNRDGLADLVVTNFSDEPTALYLSAAVGFENATYRYGLSALSQRLLSWSCHLVDFDGDGWLELFTANGHVYPQADGELTGTRYGQPDSLWRLGPRARAVPIEPDGPASILHPALGTRGSAVGDLDGDGRPDLVLTRIDGPAALGMNRMGAPNGRLVLRLEGPRTPTHAPPRTPRDAQGTRAILVVGEGPEEFALLGEVSSAVGYQSASSLELHFGLGAHARYESLRVLWPSGRIDTFPAGAAGRRLVIREGEGLVAAAELR